MLEVVVRRKDGLKKELDILNNLHSFHNYKEEQRLTAIAEAEVQRKYENYKGDITRFQKWCKETYRAESFDSAIGYMLMQVEEKGIKLSTFYRKSAAIRFYFSQHQNIAITESYEAKLKTIRALYDTEPYLEKKLTEAETTALPKDEVLHLIRQYKDLDSPNDYRIYTISLINLITANRPSEMVRLRIKDFDFMKREVKVLLVKQKEAHRKRLTVEAIQSVQNYIRLFSLKPDDYFVGHVDRWGQYVSKQINENSYRQAMKRWLQVAPYTLRKTQITSMHKKKADLSTIARQSGHKSLQTISDHYIKIDGGDLDEFI